MKVWPALNAHSEPGVVVFVCNSSAGARDWPASLAISELQVWRETPHLKLRWRFTRDYSPSSYHLPVVPQLGEGLCTPFSGPCWGFMWLKLTQGLCMLSQWLWVPTCSCPVVHRGHCFLVFIYYLWLLDSSVSSFSVAPEPWEERKTIHPRVLRWYKLVSISRGRNNKGHQVLLVKWIWEEIG